MRGRSKPISKRTADFVIAQKIPLYGPESSTKSSKRRRRGGSKAFWAMSKNCNIGKEGHPLLPSSVRASRDAPSARRTLKEFHKNTQNHSNIARFALNFVSANILSAKSTVL